MFSTSRSRSLFCSPRHQRHYFSLSISDPSSLSLRTYATSPQPRSYNQPKSTPKNASIKAEVSTRTSPLPLQSVLPTHPLSSLVNPPASTHPPPLTLPSRDPADLAYKYYFRLGKVYLAFYKTGLKALWTNYRTARSMPNQIWSKSASEIRHAVTAGALSRADFQLIRRVKSDLYKLPPFALLFMICGEFTPLVIVFVTGLVPRIIWLPAQFRKKREKAEERRRVCQREGGFQHTAGEMILSNPSRSLTDSKGSNITIYVAQSLGLYSSVLDRFVPALIPPGIVRRRVDRRLKDLEVDDFAIVRDGGVKGMDKEEVAMACEDRGIDLLEREDIKLRKDLSEWIERRRKSSKT